MNRLLRNLISLEHFKKAKRFSGQVATLLVLLLSIVLVFVLITANIGQVAVDATRLANAADTAALLMASQLATKARMLSEGLEASCGDKYECCEETGFLDVVLSIVFAIVAIVICQSCAIGLLASGVIGGAIGGALGAAIQGTSVARGAMLGAAIGGAIGSIAAGIQAGLVTGLDGVGMSNALAAGVGAVQVSESAVFIPMMLSSTQIGSMAFNALGLGASIYNRAVQNQLTADLMKQLANDVNKLGEEDGMRESAIFAALVQTVDDPNMHQDSDDIDGDADYEELIPRFAWWWHQRMLRYAEMRNSQIPAVNAFVEKMKAFRNIMAQSIVGIPCDWVPIDEGGFLTQCAPGTPAAGALEREDYKWTISEDGRRIAVGKEQGAVDGSIVHLLRGLWQKPEFRFHDYWRPGPTPEQIMAWLQAKCPLGSNQCPPPPPGYDKLDDMADGIKNMVFLMNTITPPPFLDWLKFHYGNLFKGEWYAGWIISILGRQLAGKYRNISSKINPSSNYESWSRYFYDLKRPANPRTYYYKLGVWIDYLTELKKTVRRLTDTAQTPHIETVCVNGMPVYELVQDYGKGGTTQIKITGCGYCDGGGIIACWLITGNIEKCANSCGSCSMGDDFPCRIPRSAEWPIGGIVVASGELDALGPAITDIDALIDAMSAFREDILAFANNMQKQHDQWLKDLKFGGWPAVTYRTKDTRGESSVLVEVSPYIVLPYLDDESRGSWFSGEECVVLEHYSDEEDAPCWVMVTKTPPQSVQMGFLGWFNPLNRGVSKASQVSYNGVEGYVNMVERKPKYPNYFY